MSYVEYSYPSWADFNKKRNCNGDQAFMVVASLSTVCVKYYMKTRNANLSIIAVYDLSVENHTEIEFTWNKMAE